MELSKLQNPTKRRKESLHQPDEETPVDTVKQEVDGTVTIANMDIRATSSGRERFGAGTKAWGKFPLTTPALERFSK